MVAALPGIPMMRSVVLFLLGPLVVALQFGEVFRRESLDAAMAIEKASEIVISADGYTAILNLKSESLVVPFVENIEISLISKNSDTRSFGSTDTVEVQSGDIVVIYQAGTTNPEKYRGATAENLKRMIEEDSLEKIVFGVVIQDEPVPEQGFAQLVPNFGLKELYSSPRDDSSLILMQSTFQLDPKTPNSITGYLSADDRLKMVMRRRMGHEGVVIIRNDAVCGSMTSFSYESSEAIQKGDRLIVATKVTGDIVAELHKMANVFIQEGISALNTEKYSRFNILVAEIVNVVDYLEEIKTIGPVQVLYGSLFTPKVELPLSWLFKEDTMLISNKDSAVVRIKDNGEIEHFGDKGVINFTNGRVELLNLQPSEIVIIVTGDFWTSEGICASTFNAFVGCDSPSCLEKALQKLSLDKNIIGAMAAFVSDKIGTFKVNASGWERRNVLHGLPQDDQDENCIIC
jgi:hypothetical protein